MCKLRSQQMWEINTIVEVIIAANKQLEYDKWAFFGIEEASNREVSWDREKHPAAYVNIDKHANSAWNKTSSKLYRSS